jgi:hypothetical protein
LIPLSWRFQRWGISAFVAMHLAMLALWNLPNCPIRTRFAHLGAPYLLPTGLWQNWTMFAPNPIRHTFTLQALVADRNGIFHEFKFPCSMGSGVWEGVTKVRHSKYPTYLVLDDYAAMREMAARHVVRQLGLPPESFPVDVELQYLVKESPPPGQLPDPMVPPKVQPIKAYRFPTWQEARP